MDVLCDPCCPSGVKKTILLSNKGGGFVVTWTSFGHDGSGEGIYGRIYNALGVAVSNEFRINNKTAGDQLRSAVAGLDDGGFVVSWHDADGSVYAQRFHADGSRQGIAFVVNTTKNGEQHYSSVAALADGGFVVVWASSVFDVHLLGQRYKANGERNGAEIPIASLDPGDSFPKVTGLAGGGFVVIWDFHGPDGGIFTKRYGANGLPVGTSRKIATQTKLINPLTSASVISLNNGGFIVTWRSDTGIYGQRYNAAGVRNGFTFKASTEVDARDPSVAALADGGFLVTYISYAAPDYNYSVYVQRYDASGMKAGGKFVVAKDGTDRNQARGAGLNNGRFILVWHGREADYFKDGTGIFGQRFAP